MLPLPLLPILHFSQTGLDQSTFIEEDEQTEEEDAAVCGEDAAVCGEDAAVYGERLPPRSRHARDAPGRHLPPLHRPPLDFKVMATTEMCCQHILTIKRTMAGE